jgi:hypothetical protein
LNSCSVECGQNEEAYKEKGIVGRLERENGLVGYLWGSNSVVIGSSWGVIAAVAERFALSTSGFFCSCLSRISANSEIVGGSPSCSFLFLSLYSQKA